MSRAEFTVLAMNVFYYMEDLAPEEGLTSTFDDDIAEWAEEIILDAENRGFISGKEKNDKTYFYPSTDISRAEAAAILYSIFFEE